MEKLRYKFTNRLTSDEIYKIVEDYKRDVVPEIELKNAYAKGNNPTILQRQVPSSAPDNKVPVPYGRRIISIITSYMFLPGLVTYGSENQTYLEALNEIFDYNKESLETYRIGWQTSVHGVGYEMFSNEGMVEEPTLIDNQPGYLNTMARFDKVPISETIPIYDFDIVPNLQAFIRFYTIESEDTEYIHVYYPDVKVDYQRKRTGKNLIRVGKEQEHGYDRPPLVVYENNEDLMGDFASVVPLIDAYDVLISDSMNEFDRFAYAYLIAKGFTIADKDVDKLKHKRILSLMSPDDSVEFLTKPMEVEFIKFISEQFRAEIHRGTGLPNLDDYKWGGGASGETIDKFIYLMELFTGIKEAYFKQGLKQRIELLTAYAGLDGEADEIDIVMSRNDPDKSMLQADLFTKYAGHVSEKTLLENFADFVKDAEEEMEQLKAEKDAAFEVNLDRFAPTEPPRRRSMEVRRDEKGNIIGADTTEE